MFPELLATAERQLRASVTQADRRRAASTVYYAIFHHLCRTVTDLFASTETGIERAREQVYRSLDHGAVRGACNELVSAKDLPEALSNYAKVFIQMQQIRHAADYRSEMEIPESVVRSMIDACAAAIAAFDATDEKHRRAFAILVALRKRPKA
jgi:uncharacterized protein (UPF0332 family)